MIIDNKLINHYNQGFLWGYAPVRRTGTFFFQSKETKLFVMCIINE